MNLNLNMDLLIVHNLHSGGSNCTSHTFAFWILLSSLPFYIWFINNITGWLQPVASARDLRALIQSKFGPGDEIHASTVTPSSENMLTYSSPEREKLGLVPTFIHSWRL